MSRKGAELFTETKELIVTLLQSVQNKAELSRLLNIPRTTTKLQIRSVTSLQCGSTQTTIIPVLGMALIGFLSENLAMFGK